MEKLKVYRISGIEFDSQFYHKSEADKVIAELKAQKAQAEDDCAYWKTMAQKNAEDNAVMAKQRAEAFERERHHKYKRCVTLAKMCYLMDCMMLNEASDNGTYFKESWCWKRALWYGKWKRKWLELADKFKEGI